MRHRESLRELIGEIIRGRLDIGSASTRIAAKAAEIEGADRVRFREMAENELLSLHEGNYARYRVSSSEFDAWREVWDAVP